MGSGAVEGGKTVVEMYCRREDLKEEAGLDKGLAIRFR